MTRSGRAFELPTSAPRTGESDSSSLLPTPAAAKAAQDMTLTCSGDGRDKPNKLGWALTLLPTPVADHSRGLPQPGTDYASLPNAVIGLLPTPSACVANDGEGTATWLARRELVKQTAANGNGMGMPLTIAALLIAESNEPELSDPCETMGQEV